MLGMKTLLRGLLRDKSYTGTGDDESARRRGGIDSLRKRQPADQRAGQFLAAGRQSVGAKPSLMPSTIEPNMAAANSIATFSEWEKC